MNPLLGFGSIAAASAIVVMAAQPALAAPTEITGVNVKQTSGGIALELKTRFGDRPQVFSAPRGNSWVADVINSQLSLSGSESFRQANPAPGIASVQVVPLDSNSVRIIVTGTDTLPAGEVAERSGRMLSFNVTTDSGVAAQPGAVTQQPAIAQQQVTPQPVEPVDVLIPNPKVSIDGEPAERLDPAPPFLPRAVAPPVGDIATSEILFQGSSVDLGTAVRIPRLVLREAPAREVLSLLSRVAGLNLAFNPNADGEEGAGSSSSGEGDEGPKISLDVENEPVQDVFNAVLRLSGLEGNRVNNTIFVSPQLPNSLKDIVVRTYRLNQITAGEASAFLASMGAERVVSATVREVEFEEIEVGDADNAPTLNNTTTTETSTLESDRVELQDSVPILRGMQVLADPRTNAVTIVGPRNLVAIASTKITELDLRKRQVAVNVRVIDVNLSNTNGTSASFSFDAGDNQIQFGAGQASIDFNNGFAFDNAIGLTNPGLVDDFVASLQANIVSGNSKILTDPTLVIQEGQTASVQLTEEVITNVNIDRETTSGALNTTVTFEKEDAGLNLAIQVDRIDDNGFISMSVSPSIKAVAETVELVDTSTGLANTVTLLSERSLSSGIVRLRDGQGLILSGIIQDQDRTTISKTPILGDLPILGALFRNTSRSNERNELVVLVTPNILDDSDRSTFGYSYAPSSSTRRALESNAPNLR